MAREMTPQERAATQYTMNDLFRMAMDGKVNIAEDKFVYASALQQTRRAALLDAAKLVGDYNCMHNHGKKATKACDDVFDELYRLAQEG